MRKNFGSKPMTYPQPVFIVAAYDKDGNPNAMNAAWGGIAESDRITMCLAAGHKTVKNILETGAFTVSMADAKHVVECDYLGVVSGNKVPDKLHKIGFTTYKSEFVNAPVIDQLPMALECKLISFDKETDCLIGEIVNVCADEKILDEAGNIDYKKLDPITFDPMYHTYITLGERVGKAFSDGKRIEG